MPTMCSVPVHSSAPLYTIVEFLSKGVGNSNYCTNFGIGNPKGPSINYVVSRGEGGGQKLPILLSRKTNKRG